MSEAKEKSSPKSEEIFIIITKKSFDDLTRSLKFDEKL